VGRVVPGPGDQAVDIALVLVGAFVGKGPVHVQVLHRLEPAGVAHDQATLQAALTQVVFRVLHPGVKHPLRRDGVDLVGGQMEMGIEHPLWDALAELLPQLRLVGVVVVGAHFAAVVVDSHTNRSSFARQPGPPRFPQYTTGSAARAWM